MNSLFFRKLQLEYLFLKKMEHLERPKKLCLQLSIMLSLNIFVVQPNVLARDVALRLDFFIISLFLKLLGMVEVLATHNY